MAIHEEVKPKRADKDASETPDDEPLAGVSSEAEEGGAQASTAAEPTEDRPEELPAGVASPTQLGTRRFVYAAYFAGAIGIAFLVSKALDFAWLKLQSYKPAVGEPRDEVVMPVSALVGAVAAIYYWRRTRARQLAEEVATEMSKVVWPTRTEVTSGTFVVIVTTIVSTVFFALMDKFWGFVTNLVYGGS